MKKTLLVALLVLFTNQRAQSQGSLSFDNIFNTPSAPVTINSIPGTFNSAEGPAGAFIGSDYTASLYYVNGAVSDLTAFDGDNPILFAAADVQFLGTTGAGTGHGFFGDGSGFFDSGIVTLPTTGTITVQVRAWYNGGGTYTSYDEALVAGQNVGESNPVSLYLAIGLANPPPLDGLLSFTVGVVPEPSTLALLGWSGFSFWCFRRRK
jgi:PEP-CTERM motif